MVSNECLGDRKLPHLGVTNRFQKRHKTGSKVSHCATYFWLLVAGLRKKLKFLKKCDTLLAQCDTFEGVTGTAKTQCLCGFWGCLCQLCHLF